MHWKAMHYGKPAAGWRSQRAWQEGLGATGIIRYGKEEEEIT